MRSLASHNEGRAGWASSLAQRVRCLSALAAALLAWGALPAESNDDLIPGLRGQDAARLELHDGRLSVSIRDRPWVEVLGGLRRATGMVLRVDPEPTGTVTLSFEQAPLEEGLKRLFGGDAGVILHYETASSAVPLEAWVVPRGDIQLSAPLRTSAPEAATSAPLRVDLPPAVQAAIDRIDPALRARAVRAFRSMPRDWLLTALERFLQRDPVSQVRGTDANALASIGALRALGAIHPGTSRLRSGRLAPCRRASGRSGRGFRIGSPARGPARPGRDGAAGAATGLADRPQPLTGSAAGLGRYGFHERAVDRRGAAA